MTSASGAPRGSARDASPPSGHGATWWPAWGALVLALAFFVTCGLRGLDFGTHWDEDRHVEALERSVANGRLLPGDYSYGSMCFWLGRLAQESQGWGWAGADALSTATAAERKQDLRLRMRSVFVCVSALSLLWVFLAIRAAGGSPLAAAFGAGLTAASFELGYHARWVAPDLVLMQWAALGLWASLRASRSESRARGWLDLAALAAGLGCGTKYPGGLLGILPLLAGLTDRTCPVRARWVGVLRTAGLFLFAYLVSTPGTLLDPGRFLHDLSYEMRHYAGGHPGHTIRSGLPHLTANLRYLGLHLWSPFIALAALLASGAALGGLLLLFRRGRVAALLLVYPVLAVSWMSLQRVFIVRNLLVVAPFLAVCAAMFLSFAMRGRSPRVRLAIGLLAFGSLVPGAWFTQQAAESVAGRGSRPGLEVEAREAIEDLAGEAPLISPALRQRLGPAAVEAPPSAASALLLLSEVRGEHPRLPAAQFGLVRSATGPREVNLAFYPGWGGDDRVLVLDAALLRATRHPGIVPASRPSAPK